MPPWKPASWRRARARASSRGGSATSRLPSRITGTSSSSQGVPAGSCLRRAGSTVVEVSGSHAVYVSQPDAVADLIAKVAEGVTTKAEYSTETA